MGHCRVKPMKSGGARSRPYSVCISGRGILYSGIGGGSAAVFASKGNGSKTGGGSHDGVGLYRGGGCFPEVRGFRISGIDVRNEEPFCVDGFL